MWSSVLVDVTHGIPCIHLMRLGSRFDFLKKNDIKGGIKNTKGQNCGNNMQWQTEVEADERVSSLEKRIVDNRKGLMPLVSFILG